MVMVHVLGKKDEHTYRGCLGHVRKSGRLIAVRNGPGNRREDSGSESGISDKKLERSLLGNTVI